MLVALCIGFLLLLACPLLLFGGRLVLRSELIFIACSDLLPFLRVDVVGIM